MTILLTVVIGSIGIANYLMSDPSGSSNQNTTFGSIPEAAVKDAPYPGYEYFLLYSTTTGAINSITTMPSRMVSYDLVNCGFSSSTSQNMSSVTECIFPNLPSGVGVLNATGYSNLATIASHMNAYQVNLSTLQITVKPDWTSCTNSNYGNGTVPCN
jgi:hypothetical protein